MGPIARAIRATAPPEAQRRLEDHTMHVHVESDMLSRVFSISRLFPASGWDGRLPFRRVVLEGFRRPGEMPFAFMVEDTTQLPKNELLQYHAHADVLIHVMIPSNDPGDRIQLVCGFNKRSRNLILPDTIFDGIPPEDVESSDEFVRSCEIIDGLDLLFTFMSEPRFVEQTPFSRLKRSMAAKAIGRPALRHTWVKLGWTIGGVTRPKGNVPGSAPQRAFHMVRAHWRRYDHQTPKAVHRPHREGWWVWIEAYYAGNPALGEVKHHYAPKLDDPGKSSRVVHRVVASKIAQAVNPEPYLT